MKVLKVVLAVIGLFICFPLVISILIWRKRCALGRSLKVIITVVLWVVWIGVFCGSNKKDMDNVSNKVGVVESEQNLVDEDEIDMEVEVEDKKKEVNEDVFISQVKELIVEDVGVGESITDVVLENRVLTVFVDISGSNCEYKKELAESRVSSITDDIIDLSEEEWDKIVVDFGEYGISENNKNDIYEDGYGRYFKSVSVN